MGIDDTLRHPWLVSCRLGVESATDARDSFDSEVEAREHIVDPRSTSLSHFCA
jgi:hypothetical protein